jgi:hypothetical protein
MSKAMSKAQEEFEPSSDVIKKVQEGLNNLADDGKQEDSTLVESEASQTESQTESQLEIESEISQQDSTSVDSQVSQAESQADSQQDVTSLPENYIRAAIHQGWKPEAIDKFFASDPELALTTFENIYNSTNKISKMFAAQGRNVMKAKADKTVQPDKKNFIDVKALRDKYGDDEPSVEIAEAINKGLQEAFGSKQVVETGETGIDNRNGSPSSEDIALVQTIENFFGSDDMKPFGDFYGKGDSRNRIQEMNRIAVVNMADQIIAGADLHGQELSASDALAMAHLSVSEPVREKVLRQNILKSVKKREKGITFRPSSSTAGNKKLSAKDKEKALLGKTQDRLNKLFK